jgi:hypothetical protein
VPCLKHVLDFRVTPLDLTQAKTASVAPVMVDDLTQRRTTEEELRAAAENLANA